MRFTTTILVGAFAANVLAFPTAMYEMMARAEESATLESITEAIKSLKEKRVGPLSPGFDAASQYVSNQGSHAFKAPNFAAGDQRGPCPGLNAMANHGYLPHNGVGTITQFIQGTNQVFGMGLDLAAFLAVYGAVIDGDLTSWSIGGPTLAVGLGIPQGISGSHNKYESDVSPTRGDLYEVGNDYKLVLSQWEEFFATQPDPATANYDLDVLADFRATRFGESIAQNPNFFNGPFTGVVVQPAAYTFIYRFMANKSAEYPEGILNQEVLKSFFSITGSPGSFKYTEGYEAIPSNWYKRAIGDEYTIPYFNTDLLAAAAKYPEFLSVGGNTGTVNTFTGLDISDLTGGVYNTQSLRQGDNLMCFAFQAAQQAAPDLLKGVVGGLTGALAQLNGAFADVFEVLDCPSLATIDSSQFKKFPGSKTS